MKYRYMLIVVLLLITLVLATLPVSEAQDGGEGNKISLDHPYAAFLESRAYGAELGATAEFRKMEYVAVDLENNILYMAVGEIARGMSDEEGDIQLTENKCGVIYASNLDENMNASEMYPVVVGWSI